MCAYMCAYVACSFHKLSWLLSIKMDGCWLSNWPVCFLIMAVRAHHCIQRLRLFNTWEKKCFFYINWWSVLDKWVRWVWKNEVAVNFSRCFLSLITFKANSCLTTEWIIMMWPSHKKVTSKIAMSWWCFYYFLQFCTLIKLIQKKKQTNKHTKKLLTALFKTKKNNQKTYLQYADFCVSQLTSWPSSAPKVSLSAHR